MLDDNTVIPAFAGMTPDIKHKEETVSYRTFSGFIISLFYASWFQSRTEKAGCRTYQCGILAGNSHIFFWILAVFPLLYLNYSLQRGLL
jgi:hypothetical protein